jgi:CubicO group peptidase (beta-lactamase class C family)
MTSPNITAVDQVVQDEIIKQNIVGAAVGVVKNGQIVHLNGYGHTSLDRNNPVTVNTIFRWASISKPLTAVAALQLDEQEDDFAIEDKASDHVSYWSKQGRKGRITLKHLLSNRSGVIHYGTTNDCPDNDDPDPNYDAHDDGEFNAEEAVEVFKDEDLCFEPGDDYKYSTFGFSLAAAAVEEASGQSYASWVRQNISQPLGMNSLRQATGESEGYDLTAGRLVDKTEGSKSYVLPGGGWESNIRDLALFGNALLQGTLLNNTSRMWTDSTGNNIYRLGINQFAGGDRISHGGSHDDLRTLMHLYPGRSDNLGVVVYLNGRHANRGRLARRVAMAMGVTIWNDAGEPIVRECTNQSDSGRYSGIWRKTGNDVIIRKGLSNDDFGTEWRYLRRHGYYVDDFEAYNEDGELRWDGIYRKGSGGNAMWRNFSKDSFADKWREQSDQGYRLIDVETYIVNGQRKWAGLFRPGSGRYALFRYFSTSSFAEKREEMASSGRKLIDIEAFTHNGNLRWAGVWIEGRDGLLNRNYRRDDFGRLRDNRREAGWKLIDIERYDINGGERWAGIWERSNDAERLNRNYRYCGRKDDDDNWTSLGITNRHNQWRNDGFELIDWERD